MSERKHTICMQLWLNNANPQTLGFKDHDLQIAYHCDPQMTQNSSKIHEGFNEIFTVRNQIQHLGLR